LRRRTLERATRQDRDSALRTGSPPEQRLLLARLPASARSLRAAIRCQLAVVRPLPRRVAACRAAFYEFVPLRATSVPGSTAPWRRRRRAPCRPARETIAGRGRARSGRLPLALEIARPVRRRRCAPWPRRSSLRRIAPVRPALARRA